MFAAANVSWVDDAIQRGACAADTKRLYARGRIVVWTPVRSRVAAPRSLEDLADARFKRIAIANPEHAPYGRAAQQALQRAGVWDQVKPKLVYGENVQQAMEFATSGNADAAIVALSIANLDDKGKTVAVDEHLYDPIDQALVICAKDPPRVEEAREFTAFVSSPQGTAILKRYGFTVPGSSRAQAR